MNKANKTDVVIFLGNGSKSDNWELRYGTRSYVKNLKDLGRIFVLGHIPWWIDREHGKVVHVPMHDPYKHNKDGNLLNKLLMCATLDVSDPFIRASDDQILMKESKASDIEILVAEYQEEVAKNMKDSFDGTTGPAKGWHKRLYRTFFELKARGLTAHNYEGHIPMPVHKSKIPRVLDFDFGDKNGYTVNSLYYNAAFNTLTHGNLHNRDAKFTCRKEDVPLEEISRGLDRHQFCSYNDAGLRNPNFRSVVEARFPEPAEFEKTKD